MLLPTRRRLAPPSAVRAARRVAAPEHSLPVAHQAVLDLQASIGNAAVTTLLARDTDKKTPALKPRFAFVTGQLKPKEWSAKSRLEQFSDVAQLADATSIASVASTSTSSINEISDVQVGDAAKPGLNLAKKYEHDATAGFIVDSSTWRGDILPAASSGAVPEVALVLGPKAFAHDEAYALGTVRHEMEHARHMELSVEWLLKWREAGAKKAFSSWIAEQAIKSKIPPEVLPLIRVEHDSARGDTELLAYIEGFVTTVQYLPERPDLSLMLTGSYPHAISQLQELGKPENSGWTDKVRTQGLDRIHELCCKGLDDSGRQKLVAWLEALLDPSRFGTPTMKDEERAIRMIHNDFGSGSVTEGKESRAQLKRLLEDMLKVAKKPCK
jgi:hypothetical protein